MALWQYTFQVLTKESFEYLYEYISVSFDDFGFDEEPFWEYQLIDKSYFEEINNFLTKGQSWSHKIDLYGDQEANCFEVSFNQNNIVESVSFRIDFRTNYELILNNIIEFCILKGLIILDEELNRIPLNYESVRSVIINTPQIKMYNRLSGNNKD